MTSPDKLLTTREAKEMLNVGWGTLYEFIHSGKLKAVKLGGDTGDRTDRRRYRIRMSDIEAFLNPGVKEEPKLKPKPKPKRVRPGKKEKAHEDN